MKAKTLLILLLVTAFAPAAVASNRVFKNLAYGPDPANRLDLYLPAKPMGTLPLVVWIHGGAWVSGDKRSVDCTWLVNDGYAIASINYRLAPHSHFPAQLDDCKLAIRWLRSNASRYQIDPKRIGVWGESAGGTLAALLAADSQIQAVCDWFGPSDLLTLDAGKVGGDANPVSQFLGGQVSVKPELARQASPSLLSWHKGTPFLICQGDRDNLVPISQSQMLYDTLRRAGDEATLVRVTGAGHGGPGFYRMSLLKQVHAFFDAHLKAVSTPTTRPAVASATLRAQPQHLP